jgi:hypothetical protein
VLTDRKTEDGVCRGECKAVAVPVSMVSWPFAPRLYLHCNVVGYDCFLLERELLELSRLEDFCLAFDMLAVYERRLALVGAYGYPKLYILQVELQG